MHDMHEPDQHNRQHAQPGQESKIDHSRRFQFAGSNRHGIARQATDALRHVFNAPLSHRHIGNLSHAGSLRAKLQRHLDVGKMRIEQPHRHARRQHPRRDPQEVHHQITQVTGPLRHEALQVLCRHGMQHREPRHQRHEPTRLPRRVPLQQKAEQQVRREVLHPIGSPLVNAPSTANRQPPKNPRGVRGQQQKRQHRRRRQYDAQPNGDRHGERREAFEIHLTDPHAGFTRNQFGKWRSGIDHWLLVVGH